DRNVIGGRNSRLKEILWIVVRLQFPWNRNATSYFLCAIRPLNGHDAFVQFWTYPSGRGFPNDYGSIGIGWKVICCIRSGTCSKPPMGIQETTGNIKNST